MSLEKIPEMQIVKQTENYKAKRWKCTNLEPQPGMKGRFIVLNHDNKTYVHATDDPDGYLSHKDLEYGFNDQLENRSTLISATNGGFFEIDTNSIKFYGESERFGKFETEIVRPIAERYASLHLRKYSAKFE